MKAQFSSREEKPTDPQKFRNFILDSFYSVLLPYIEGYRNMIPFQTILSVSDNLIPRHFSPPEIPCW